MHIAHCAHCGFLEFCNVYVAYCHLRDGKSATVQVARDWSKSSKIWIFFFFFLLWNCWEHRYVRDSNSKRQIKKKKSPKGCKENRANIIRCIDISTVAVEITIMSAKFRRLNKNAKCQKCNGKIVHVTRYRDSIKAKLDLVCSVSGRHSSNLESNKFSVTLKVKERKKKKKRWHGFLNLKLENCKGVQTTLASLVLVLAILYTFT